MVESLVFRVQGLGLKVRVRVRVSEFIKDRIVAFGLGWLLPYIGSFKDREPRG